MLYYFIFLLLIAVTRAFHLSLFSYLQEWVLTEQGALEKLQEYIIFANWYMDASFHYAMLLLFSLTIHLDLSCNIFMGQIPKEVGISRSQI